ncbi:MAG TPA: alpha/beta hydrolase [Bradyrhizobium sp.]|nr:alpha/beta hydrolase [Bradyrhizobium sp.]
MSVLTTSTGARLNYGETGTGHTVIMVHGSPGEGRAWANVIGQFQGGLHILTPDLPGYGGSDPLPRETTNRTAAMASAIGELIVSCDGPIWLCGHSYGANVALHAAVQWRNRVGGIVLLEPVFLRALQLGGDVQLYKTVQAFFVSYLVRAEFAETDAIGIMIDFWCGEGFYDKLPSRTKGFLNAAISKNAEDVRASFAETIGATALGTFDRPVMIAFGDRSPKVAAMIAASLKKLLPRAVVAPIRGATHLLLDSHAGDVARLIGMTVR